LKVRSFGSETIHHDGGPLNNPTRQRARIVPPSPITVAIDDENSLPLGYGVIANVSDAGGCIWTDSRLEPGARLGLRVSFAHPSEVHEVAAQVVWGDDGEDREGCRMHRYGLLWKDASSACVRRLRDLALGAPGERRTPARGTGPVPRPVANS
jgi:hypothetical protein